MRLVSLYRVSVSPLPSTGVARPEWPRLGSIGYVLAWLSLAAVLLLLTYKHWRRLLGVSAVAALVFVGLNLFAGRHLLPQILIWLSPVSLSERYVQTLVANDLEAALRLTDGSDRCTMIMAEVFREDQRLLRQRLGPVGQGAGLGDVSVKSVRTYYDKPVPTRVIARPVPTQLATIMVRTDDGGTAWLSLRMRYSPFLGARHICGTCIDS